MSEIKIALVTGASSGIGRAAAVAMHRAGWQVIITARRQDALDETASLMAQAKPASSSRTPYIVFADLTVPIELRSVFTQIKERYGRLDLLFNNAGAASPRTPIQDLELDTFLNVMNVNVTACFLCAQEAVRMMREQTPKGGRIINNGSISAYTPRPHSLPYTMSKHAILGLTKCLALDGRADNIACSQLDIGNAQSAMSAHKPGGALQVNAQMLVEPVMDASWAGEAVVYMANLPLEVNILNQTIMPTDMPFVGRG